ncbi:LOW QUALITY PROTEIN: RPA-related protein RADX [Erethizon dorsatum]
MGEGFFYLNNNGIGIIGNEDKTWNQDEEDGVSLTVINFSASYTDVGEGGPQCQYRLSIKARSAPPSPSYFALETITIPHPPSLPLRAQVEIGRKLVTINVVRRLERDCLGTASQSPKRVQRRGGARLHARAGLTSFQPRYGAESCQSAGVDFEPGKLDLGNGGVRSFPTGSAESSQPQASPSHAGLYCPNPERDRVGGGVPRGAIRRAGSGPRSWTKGSLQIMGPPRQWVTPLVVLVTVLVVQRYLLEDEPRAVPKPPLYCFDVTVLNRVCREKCYMDPQLNSLVHHSSLKVGIEMKISRACLYNEKKLGQGISCIHSIHSGSPDAISLKTPFGNRTQQKKPERPLRDESHCLALWNKKDPYGDTWLTNEQPEEYINFSSLLTLLYYKPPDCREATFLEVADSSGTVSMIMWNALCPEWYKSFWVGLALLLEDYSVKKSYPFRMQPLPVDPQEKTNFYSGLRICLDLQDPPTNINIPEKQMKPEWRLAKLNYFITRSELDNMPKSPICDVIGMLVFVERVQQSTKTENHEYFWSYHWIHIADGTFRAMFIVESFSTSQSEIFENIYPMTYLCTQLKVVRNDTQIPKLLDFITTIESQVFITGHRGQLYTSNTKGKKNFIQCVKAKTNSGEMKNTVISGYYPYPPVPETFSKISLELLFCCEKLLTAMSEVRKEMEDLPYRKQKHIVVQAIITVINYIPHSCATESASASETPCNFVYPESIPWKFILEHTKFFTEQYTSEPTKYISLEGKPKLDGFKNARSLEHIELTILGLNHEIAIDAAFLPTYLEYITSQIDTLLTCMNYSCVYSVEVTGNDQLSGPRAPTSDIVKAVTELDRVHIIAILDICNLRNNKVKLYLQKIYSPEKTS